MYELLDAQPATLVVVMAASMVTPPHLLASYLFSGASALSVGVSASTALGVSTDKG